MSAESSSEKPARRPRYRGTHPRQFHEKYKEHQPDQFPDEIAHILDSGKTPAGMHRPILVREILQILAPQPGEIAVDCTLGYGGHARELLQAIQPRGRLIGTDADPIEFPKTVARLQQLGFPESSLTLRRMNFAGIAAVLATEAPEGADLLLADLGLSSMQIDQPERGFSVKVDGPLDMRMNPQRGLSAAGLLERLNAEGLAELLRENADEPLADRLSRHILHAQASTPIQSTRQLAEVVRAFTRQHATLDDQAESMVRRVFQALRIGVNDEFGALQTFLKQMPGCLRAGGRIAILTFHSGEDRRVKTAFKAGLASGDYSAISDEIIRPSAEEQRLNPRSSSAKLRWAIRGPR